jgi:hypothetical protein
MKDGVPRGGEGFDIVINGANRWIADLELSVIAGAGFHKQNYRDDTMQIRTRKDGSLRTVLGPGSLEPSG